MAAPDQLVHRLRSGDLVIVHEQQGDTQMFGLAKMQREGSDLIAISSGTPKIYKSDDVRGIVLQIVKIF